MNSYRGQRKRIRMLTACGIATLLLGGLFLLLDKTVLAWGHSAAVSDLRINEFMAINSGSVIDPADAEPGQGADDWLEIYNGGSESVDLFGLFITDNRDELTKHQITGSLTIPPGGFLVLWADDETNQGVTHLPFRLSGSGEDLALVASDGVTVIDSYTFGPQESDVSQGRVPDGSDTWVTIATSPTPGASNVVAPTISKVRHAPLLPQPGEPVTVTATISTAATTNPDITSATLFYRTKADGIEESSWFSKPFQIDAQATGLQNRSGKKEVSHEQQNPLHISEQIAGQTDDTLVEYYIDVTDSNGERTIYPSAAPTETRRYLVGYEGALVRINELMADNSATLEDPDELNEYPDWFELINTGETPIDLGGYYLTDDLENPTRYVISGSLTMQPGAIVLFYADDDPSQGQDHTNFRLENSGETLALYEPLGAAPVDLVQFDRQPGDQSYGRFPDGAETWGDPLCSTPGESNILCNQQIYMPTTLNSAAVTPLRSNPEQAVQERAVQERAVLERAVSEEEALQ